MKTSIKYIFIILAAISLVSWFFDDDEKAEPKKREIVVKQYFKSDDTFVILCKGWPREELTGKARVSSAKEAALMNAQFTTRDLFDKSVDVVKNGNIEKYSINDDYVTIHYVIKYPGLRKYYKEK